MTDITSYRKEIEDSMKRVKNNCDYFASFDDLYIPQKLKEHLDIIYTEMEKIRDIVVEKEKDFVHLEHETDE